MIFSWKKFTIPLVLVMVFFCGVSIKSVFAEYSQVQFSDECKNANQTDLSTFFCWIGVQIFDVVNPPPNLPKTGFLNSITLKVHSRVVDGGFTILNESGYFWRKTNSTSYCYLPGFSVPNDDLWHDVTLEIFPNALDGYYNRGTDNCILDFSKDKLEYIYANNYAVDTAWTETNIYPNPEQNYQGRNDFGMPKDKSLYFKLNSTDFQITKPTNEEAISNSPYEVTGVCPVSGTSQLAVSAHLPVSPLKESEFKINCEQGKFSASLSLDSTVTRIFVTDKTTGSIVYVPVTVKINTRTPVLIVPGIMGTEINKGDEVLWPDINRMMYTNNDRFMDSLSFNPDNTPLDTSLQIGNVLGEPSQFFDYSKGLVSNLISEGYELGKTLFTFPYDWRKDLSVIAKENLKGQIDYILNQAESGQVTGKVDIIAHSQGGLVVKRLLYEMPEYQNKINKLVFVGTPHLGSPKAAKALLYGDSMDVRFLGMGLDPEEVKRIGLNMPAVYQLLPSDSYLSRYGGYIGKGEKLNSDLPVFHIKTLNFQESKQFLKDENLNTSLVDQASNFHSTEFDNFSLENSGIKTYNIVGCQQPTISKIIKKPDGGFGLDYTAGDETVPVASANNLPGALTFYALDSEHGSMLARDGIREQIVNLISGSTLPTNGNIVPYSSECFFDGKKISVHSPVDLHIYDKFGNHVGPMPDGTFEHNISGVAYDVIGHEKFAFLPKNGNFIIKLLATGSGVFDFYSSTVQNGQTTETVYYNQIPIATTSKATIDLNNDKVIVLDSNGDGQAEENVVPSALLDQNQSKDLTPPVTSINLTGEQGQANYFRSDVNINLHFQDYGEADGIAGILKTYVKIDDGNFQEYSNSVSVNSEGTHTIQFYSLDKAGNKELVQIKDFVIDKTPPEFTVFFNVENKDLVFSGEDNLSKQGEVRVIENENKILLEDLSGNITELGLKEKDRKKSLSAELVSVKYNGQAADISKNRFNFVWVYDKKGVLKSLAQHIATKKDFALLSMYDGKNTKIMSWTKGVLPEIKTYKGLKIIKINSNQGKLLWSIE